MIVNGSWPIAIYSAMFHHPMSNHIFSSEKSTGLKNVSSNNCSSFLSNDIVSSEVLQRSFSINNQKFVCDFRSSVALSAAAEDSAHPLQNYLKRNSFDIGWIPGHFGWVGTWKWWGFPRSARLDPKIDLPIKFPLRNNTPMSKIAGTTLRSRRRREKNYLCDLVEDERTRFWASYYHQFMEGKWFSVNIWASNWTLGRNPGNQSQISRYSEIWGDFFSGKRAISPGTQLI